MAASKVIHHPNEGALIVVRVRERIVWSTVPDVCKIGCGFDCGVGNTEDLSKFIIRT
jgi:hypothetical protein